MVNANSWLTGGRCLIGLSVLLFSWASPAGAVDGVIEINQTRALAGGITPSDSPGFPVQLDSEGSYRLTGNLDLREQDSPENLTAIDCFIIPSNDKGITIDLNGFSIIGPTVCSGKPTECENTGTGIGIDVDGCEARVYNGIVQGLGADGIRGAKVVERINARSNGGIGIYARDGIVRGCHATANGGNGIEVIGDGLVLGNYVENGGENGIVAGFGFVAVTDNTVSSNAGVGIEAFGLVSGNVVRLNTGVGLDLPETGTGYVGNTMIQNNGGDGNPQVAGGTEIGTNICGTNTTCP